MSLLRLLRPKQWTKNVFVFSGLIFSQNILNPPLFAKTFQAFILFCMISSCVYIINDLVDIEKDKLHPTKKYRPLVSGDVNKRVAIIILSCLMLLSISGSFALDFKFGLIILSYFIINTLYSIKLKHIVIIDIMIISVGFVLRAISGAVVINVEISPWLLICTVFLSLFLALSKRKNELIVLEDNAKNHRKILGDYSIDLIEQMLPVVTSCAIISYALYTFTGARTNIMMITIPFVIYGIFRYQYLTYKKGFGGRPESAFFCDKPFIINVLSWGISSILILSYF